MVFQPMPATATSFAWVVVALPLEAAVPLPDAVPVTSSDAPTPTATSTTVKAIADDPVPVAVTVTLPELAGIMAAPVTYQTSSSTCFPGATAVAFAQVFPDVSVTVLTMLGGAVVSRTRITATSRSPLPVAEGGEAEIEVSVGDVLAAPKDSATVAAELATA